VRCLAPRGLCFDRGGHGAQGLDEAARGRQADLVILDLGLPDMNGIDFIRDHA
jgi:DNA-binding response OmpR family regulator